MVRILRANLASDKENNLLDDENFKNIFSQNYRSQYRSDNDYSANVDTKKDAEIARYYANLEIPYGADLETVRKAWKILLRKYHPDLHSDDAEKVRVANELVQGLNNAYKELEKRLKAENQK
jgi:DnaJ-domain-containing protein 1